jgi:chain length determinant protein tyrosine kinase EpsG
MAEAMRPHIVEPREPVLGKLDASVENRTIGRILVDLGKLKPRDVSRIFDLHRQRGLRFGEAARKLRLVKDADIQYALSVQFNYPYLKPGQAVLGQELVIAHAPFDAQSEALRDLRTQLLLQWLSEDRKVLAVASPGARDGRSYVAANLAVAFAQLGDRTLLIDADLRVPRQHRIFGVNGASGLAQVLSGRAGIEAAERISYFEGLSVLGAGAVPPNPLELLSRQAFQNLLADARRAYSIVIVDTPAGARGSDTRIVAARADGALLVARQDGTRIREIEHLRRAITACDVPVVGAVLNRI